MITNVQDYEKVLASMPSGGEDKNKVTNQNRQDWNDYTAWLKKRGVAGNAKLDQNNLGGNLLKQYIKENPKTTLTPDLIIPLQHDLANLRGWHIDNNGVPTKGNLTPQQLEDFSNFSGGDGSVSSTEALNKKLDEYGLQGSEHLREPILKDMTDSKNVKSVQQNWIAAATARALAKAKSLGIPATPEAFEQNKKVIFGNDQYADSILNDKNFQMVYPNYIKTVAKLYTDRSNEYDKQLEDSHMADHKVIDNNVGSRMTSLTYPQEYIDSFNQPASTDNTQTVNN